MWAQRYAADGTPSGPEFRVNAIEIGKQFNPVVAMLSDGGFAIAFHSYNADTRDNEILVRRFDANGEGDDELQVNTYSDSKQLFPSIAATPDGLLMAWESFAQDGDDFGVYARYMDDSLRNDETEFQVSTQSAYLQTEAAVATAADGRFVTAWTQTWADNSTVVHLRVFPAPAP